MKTKAEIVKQEATEVQRPDDMIRLAIEKGADLEKMKSLLELQERWEANEAKKAFHRAMADFKQNPPDVEKDKTVKFGTTQYSHASLANAVKKITPELSKHGLSVSWRTQQNGTVSVTCRITHVLGYSEETTLSAQADSSGSKNSIQAIGSTISYLERYSLLAILGLAAHDQDDDGRGSEQEEVIDEQQLATLVDYLTATESDVKKLLKWAGIEKLEELTKAKYQKALNMMKSKESKAVQK